jgi:hypothetical protein
MPPTPTFLVMTGTVQKDGPLSLQSKNREVPLYDLIAGIETPHKFIFYHFPISGLDPNRPGGGSCLYSFGECPVGHNDHRSWLFHFQAEGIPKNENSFWKIGSQELNLNILRGHQCGVVVVPTNITSIKPEQVNILTDQIGRLKTMLDSVKSLKARK